MLPAAVGGETIMNAAMNAASSEVFGTPREGAPASAPLSATVRPNVCPALAAAETVARLEASLALACRKIEAAPHTSLDLPRLEADYEALILAAEAARADLAEAEATSVAGAAAQLLAAIRDIRVRDDVERARASVLEERALRFLGSADILERETARCISRTGCRS